MKYIVHCMEKLFYEVEVKAESPEAAIEAVKDHFPNYEDAIDSVMEDFEAILIAEKENE